MIETICCTLGETFPGIKIYKEQVKQIKRPAFFVRELESVHTRHVGNLYTRSCNFAIRYFTKEDTLSDYAELREIADKLYSALEWMEFNGQILRGYEMKYRIEDNVLQFFVTCRERVRKLVNDPLMKELETNIEKGN